MTVEDLSQVEGIIEVESDEDPVADLEIDEAGPSFLWANHGSKVKNIARTGKKKGLETIFFKCNYCAKDFQGPSSGTFLGHLRKIHRNKCPDLIQSKSKFDGNQINWKSSRNQIKSNQILGSPHKIVIKS